MKKLIGHVLRGQDLDASFYKDAPAGVVCPYCGSCLEPSYVPNQISIKANSFDVVATDDLQTLITGKFLAFLRNKTGLFIAATNISIKHDLHFIKGLKKIPFDLEVRNSKIGDTCPLCPNPKYVVGATPAYIKLNDLDESGIFETDIAFGDQKGKSPLIIVGLSLQREITAHNFKGVHFKDAYSSLSEQS